MKKIVNLLIIFPMLVVGCNQNKEITNDKALNIINDIKINNYENYSTSKDLTIEYNSKRINYNIDFNYDENVCYIKNDKKDAEDFYHINKDNYIELDLNTEKYHTMNINNFTITRWDKIILNVNNIREELNDLSNQLLDYFKVVVSEDIKGYSFYSNKKDSIEIKDDDDKLIIRYEDNLLSYLEVIDEFKVNISFESDLKLPSLNNYEENEYKAILPNEDNDFINSIIEKSNEKYNYQRDYTIVRKYKSYINDELQEEYESIYKYDYDKKIAEYRAKDGMIFTFVYKNETLAHVFSSSLFYSEYNGDLTNDYGFRNYLNPFFDKENTNMYFKQYQNYSLWFDDKIDDMTRFYKKSNEDFYFETRYFAYRNYEKKSYKDSYEKYQYKDSLIDTIEKLNEIYESENEIYYISETIEYTYDKVDLNEIEFSNKYTKLNVKDFNKLIK